MRRDEAFQRLRRERLMRMVQLQNVGRRRFWRRVGEFLAVGKDPLELNIRVEVLEQNLRRDGALVCERHMRDDKNRRNERYADPPPHGAPHRPRP